MIRDNGVGMSPEVAARAFDPFFTTKGIGKGTGLGLSQVHGLARQAGGTVRIESTLGQGATVRMLLPCAEAQPATESPATHASAGPVQPTAIILLVDDDDDLRPVLAAALRDVGYTVLEAADGAEGLRMLQAQTPDMLVADFAMPGMTGAELARSARSLVPDLPIIFATGYTETADLAQGLSPGPRLLRKPFRLSELQAAIEQALAL